MSVTARADGTRGYSRDMVVVGGWWEDAGGRARLDDVEILQGPDFAGAETLGPEATGKRLGGVGSGGA